MPMGGSQWHRSDGRARGAKGAGWPGAGRRVARRAGGFLIRSGHCAVELPVFDLTDFKRDLSELSDRLGHAQDCL